jgi:hypothetical protein
MQFTIAGPPDNVGIPPSFSKDDGIPAPGANR